LILPADVADFLQFVDMGFQKQVLNDAGRLALNFLHFRRRKNSR